MVRMRFQAASCRSASPRRWCRSARASRIVTALPFSPRARKASWTRRKDLLELLAGPEGEENPAQGAGLLVVAEGRPHVVPGEDVEQPAERVRRAHGPVPGPLELHRRVMGPVDLFGEIVLEARKGMTLRVGEGSITLRADGKILIKGKDLVSHARRMNRIRGGSVSLN